MEPLGNDKVQNFLLSVTANAENFSMCEQSAIDTPSELSFNAKQPAHVIFKEKPFIAKLQEWLHAHENVLETQLAVHETHSDLTKNTLNFVEQVSDKIDSSIAHKEQIRHHLSAPLSSSGLPVHHDQQSCFIQMLESLQHLASKQDDCNALSSKKICQTIHQQIDTAVIVEQTNTELQQTLLNMAADSEVIRQRKLRL